MATGIYTGVDGVARKVKTPYVGVDGVARKVTTAYRGVDGVARKCYSGTATPEADTLDGCSWANISEVSASGQASNFWSVGDSKAVLVKGMVGTLSVNATLYVYIIGFDHNGATNSIDFGTFKTSATDSKTVCLRDKYYETDRESIGTDVRGFRISDTDYNPSNRTRNGWKGCDLRNYVLGSGDIAGEDATSGCPTNPVANTLMAALPSDLRAVMKPMNVWSQNRDASGYSVEYLPLLAYYEIFGAIATSSDIEADYLQRYEYYSLGNSQIKNGFGYSTSTSAWWTRTGAMSTTDFCWCISQYSWDKGQWLYANYSRGVAPIFRV